MNGAEGILKLTYRRRKNGQTYLANQFYQLPLQILPPYYQDGDGTAYTYLLNPAGGVLQNDRLTIEVDLESQARALITTPSAGKFYRMEEGFAKLENTFRVGENAVLEYWPDYNIPYADTWIEQETVFDLAASATLIASDLILPGRMESGELFRYQKYRSKTKVLVGGSLLGYESICLEPKKSPLTKMGVLEGDLIYGTVLFVAPTLSPFVVDEIRDCFNAAQTCKGAVSLPEKNFGVVKLLGSTVESMQWMMTEIWGILRKNLLGKERARIRKF